MSRRKRIDDSVSGLIKRRQQLTRRRAALRRELARLRTVFAQDVRRCLRQALIDPIRYIPAVLEDPPVYPDRHALALLLSGALAVERELSELATRLDGLGVDAAGIKE